MVKNLVSGPILTLLAQIWAPKLFFSWILTLLDVRYCWKLSMYVVSRNTNEANFKKLQKNLVLGPILGHLAEIWATRFFSQKSESVSH